MTDHDPTGVGHVEDITASVVWSSSDETVLVIDANGLATAVGDGDVVVTASKDGVSASTIARTVSIACPYPADHDTGVTYDTVLPPLFWLDAYRQDGSTEDFRMEQAFCNAETYKTILFVIGAGWCPYCPDYMRAVNERAADLEAAGSLVVYVQIETAGGAPANNQQANAIVDHEVTTANGPSFRVGDGSCCTPRIVWTRSLQWRSCANSSMPLVGPMAIPTQPEAGPWWRIWRNAMSGSSPCMNRSHHDPGGKIDLPPVRRLGRVRTGSDQGENDDGTGCCSGPGHVSHGEQPGAMAAK